MKKINSENKPKNIKDNVNILITCVHDILKLRDSAFIDLIKEFHSWGVILSTGGFTSDAGGLLETAIILNMCSFVQNNSKLALSFSN